MKDIKIGDRVLCINAKGKDSNLKEGREYIVYDILQCGCGVINLNVGTTFNYGISNTYCTTCGNDLSYDETDWNKIERFVKKEEQVRYEVQYVKIEVDIEDPILN